MVPHTESPREKLEYLTKMADELVTKKLYLKQLEAQAAACKTEIELLEQTDIPDFMLSIGMQSAGLLNGKKIEVKPYYYARIPSVDNADKRAAALGWLRDNKFGGIIKEQLIIVPDSPDSATLVMDFLNEIKQSYEEQSSVHHKTLEAWLKEQVIKGEVEIPLELFSGHVGRKATVK